MNSTMRPMRQTPHPKSASSTVGQAKAGRHIKVTRQPRHRSVWLLLVVFITAFVVIPASAALAKTFWISDAEVDVTVNEDGSLKIIEDITFDFDGTFTGAYRDIPLRTDELVYDVVVSDASGPYTIGGCTTLDVRRLPGRTAWCPSRVPCASCGITHRLTR